MSCFKLPKETCAKLTNALTEFWWSSGNNRKKISWVAWQKLCKDKEAGGLGFKELEKFNQSLLAKQAWRIWENPHSLVARILRSRYFKSADFLDCGVGSRPSYAWRSIVHGRDLLKQGLLKVVGDGVGTKVWLENWIPSPIPRTPMYHQDAIVDLTLRVCDLMAPNSCEWDEGKLRELFTEEDVHHILQIKIQRSREDELKWGFSRNGIYDAKSGYQLLVDLSIKNSSQSVSLPPLERKLWRELWKTNTSPKLKHFLWRILSGALAVKQQLASRGIPVDTMCPMCHQEPETICHMLFQCPLSLEVWELSSLPLPPAGFSKSSTFLNLHYLLESSKKKSIEPKLRLAFPWVCWNLWKNRNLFCFEKCKMDAGTLIEKAMEEASTWLQLHSFIPAEAPAITVDVQSMQVWEKPPSGFVKCNVSSVWSANTRNVGAAWIIRDHYGKPLFHSRRSFGGVKSQVEATMVVCVWVTEALTDIKMNKVIIEMAGPHIPPVFAHASLSWFLQPLWRRFRRAVDKLEVCKVSRIPIGCNSIAYEMAMSALQVQWQQSYFARNGPEWLDSRISREALMAV